MATATTVNFGIAPFFTLDRATATIVGEGVTLVNTDFDLSSIEITITKDSLNAFVVDTSDGDLSLNSSAEISAGDISFGAEINDPMFDRIKEFAENSYKATIANLVAGDPTRDIGTMENDTSLSGNLIVTQDTLTEIRNAIITAINISKQSVVSAAEELIGISGETGRVTNDPFIAGDELVFNALLTNGDISLSIDPLDLTDNSLFFTVSGIASGITFDSNGELLVNGNDDTNIYILPGVSRSAADTDEYCGGSGTATGYINAATTTSGLPDTGSVLVRMKLTVIA